MGILTRMSLGTIIRMSRPMHVGMAAGVIMSIANSRFPSTPHRLTAKLRSGQALTAAPRQFGMTSARVREKLSGRVARSHTSIIIPNRIRGQECPRHTSTSIAMLMGGG